MNPQLLRRLEPTSDTPYPTWEPIPKKPSKGLLRAARVFEWMERYLQIRVKDNNEAALAPFRMNTVQQLLAQYVAECWHRGRPVKIMVPKARQMGISTFWQALGFAMCCLIPGYNVGTVAHDEASAAEIFGKSKTFLRNLQGWPYELVSDQAGRTIWATESGMHCGTAKTGGSLFHGFTFQMIHWSEAANYNDRGNDAEDTVAAAKPALAETNLTIEVFESTAKGKDAFYWERCEKARDPESKSNYTLVFLPWFLQQEYRMSWTRYRQFFLDAGKRDPGAEFVPTPEERNLRDSLLRVEVEEHNRFYRYCYELSDEQLIWRRWTLEDKCGGKPDLFKRYYPSTYEEAFTASASCMFDAKTIDHYRRKSVPALATGNPVNAGPQTVFEQDIRGKLKVWKHPNPNAEYIIGADIGGERKRSDPSCAYVLDRYNYEVVAVLHGHFEWDDYADKLYDLGQYYNFAELVVERNHNPAVIKRLVRRDYPSIYYHADEVDGGKAKTPGLSTNVKTRPEMIDKVDMLCRRKLLTNPDPKFPGEMETFVWVPKANNSEEGTYRAVGGNHDDRIMALALALFRLPIPDVQPDWEGPPEKETYAMRLYKQILARAKANEDSPPPLSLTKAGRSRAA